MKVIWDYLTENDKQYLLSLVSDLELSREYMRRIGGGSKEVGGEEREEQFQFQDKTEKDYAYAQLRSRYSFKETVLILSGKMEVPPWLVGEILKVRQ